MPKRPVFIRVISVLHFSVLLFSCPAFLLDRHGNEWKSLRRRAHLGRCATSKSRTGPRAMRDQTTPNEQKQRRKWGLFRPTSCR